MDSRPWPGSISARLRSTLIDRTLSLKNPAPPPAARSWRAASLPLLPGCPLSLLRGRWVDNVFIERLWRSLKYECVYLHAFETGSELRAGLLRWIGYYIPDGLTLHWAGAHPTRHTGRA